MLPTSWLGGSTIGPQPGGGGGKKDDYNDDDGDDDDAYESNNSLMSVLRAVHSFSTMMTMCIGRVKLNIQQIAVK